MLDLDKEMDKLAQLVALRAQRKLGRKPNLKAVAAASESDEKPPEATVETPEKPTLPCWSEVEAVDVSERAVKMETIMRIAISWRWLSFIKHFLQMKGVPYMSDLSDPQLDDLLGRMHGFVDAAETGCSLGDQPDW